MLLASLALAAALQDEAAPASPYDEVTAVEIRVKSEPFEGLGLAEWVDYEAPFGGTLYLWTRSKVPLVLLVQDPQGGLVAHDAQPGADTIHSVELPVLPGAALRIGLVSRKPEAVGYVELHRVAAPETEETLKASKAAMRVPALVADLLQRGQRDEAQDLLRKALEALDSVEGSRFSGLVAKAMRSLGAAAYEAGAFDVMLAAVERVRAHVERTRPPGHPDILRAHAQHALALRESGDLRGALALEEEVLEVRERSLPPAHFLVVGAQHELAATLLELGEVERARSLFERVLEVRSRTLEPDHPELVALEHSLAMCRRRAGDLDGARELEERVLAARERALPADHADVVLALLELARTESALGEVHRAKLLFERAVAAQEAKLPPDHPALLASLTDLARLLAQTGELQAARALLERVVEARAASLPEGHPDRLRAKAELAGVLHRLGDLETALALEQEVLAGFRERLAPDDPELLRARLELSVTESALGELERARATQEELLALWERTVRQEDPDRLDARRALAKTLARMGDLSAAREFLLQVLEVRERVLPPDHPDLWRTRRDLAELSSALGDFAGARDLRRRVLEFEAQRLPGGHPALLRASEELALAMEATGELDGAIELQKAVLESLESQEAEEGGDPVETRAVLAGMLFAKGDLDGARANFLQVLEERKRSIGRNHPAAVFAEEGLACALARLGELDEAADSLSRVYYVRNQSLPETHVDRLASAANLGLVELARGDEERARQLLFQLLNGLADRAVLSLTRGSREVLAVTDADDPLMDVALLLNEAVEPENWSRAFEVIETRRSVAAIAPAVSAAAERDDELADLRHRARVARARLEALYASRAKWKDADKGIVGRLRELSAETERAEAAFRDALAGRGLLPPEIRQWPLAQALPEKSAVVSYLRHGARRLEPGSARPVETGDRLTAFVLAAGSTVERVDLGPVAELETLVGEWREALDGTARPADEAAAPDTEEVVDDAGFRPLLDERGRELEAGRALRQRLLDPVLDVMEEEPERLYVRADDLVRLVPLDALPSGGERLGDRMEVVLLSSFAGFFAVPEGPRRAPSLLALGNVDYGDASVPTPPILSQVAASLDSARAGVPSPTFAPLEETELELVGVARLFEEESGRDAVLLQGPDASKASLVRGAPGMRDLHLATHAWFAGERVPSVLDSTRSDWRPLEPAGLRAELSGLSPFTLCGLALAGADGGRATSGRVPGILTAEELCAVDLSACELAVVSACAPTVAPHRAAEGLGALVASLHAAGARTVVTSLWRGDGEATRRLMRTFYTHLWRGRLSPSEAMRRAKRALRVAGDPPNDWAGFAVSVSE